MRFAAFCLLALLVSSPLAANAEYRDLGSVASMTPNSFRPDCSYRIRYLDRLSNYHFYQVTNAYKSYSVAEGGSSDVTRALLQAPIPGYELKQLVTAQRDEPLRYTSAPRAVHELRVSLGLAQGRPAVIYLEFSQEGQEEVDPLFLKPELFLLQRECALSRWR